MKPADLDLLVELLTRRQASDDSGQAWATVTATAPLRVRPDRASGALDITPIDLVGNLRAGARVRIGIIAGQVYIVGRAAPALESLPIAILAGSGAYAPTAHRDPTTGEVWLSGGVTMTGSGGTPDITFNAANIVGKLPEGWRPTKTIAASAGPYGAYNAIFAGARVLVNGDIEVYVNNRLEGGTTGGVIPFTALRYFAA